MYSVDDLQTSNWDESASMHADHPPEILHPYTSKRSAMPVSQVTGRIRTKRVSVGLGSIVLATSVGLVLPWKIFEKGSKLLMVTIELVCRVEMSVRPWPYCIKKHRVWKWLSFGDYESEGKDEEAKVWVLHVNLSPDVPQPTFSNIFCDETDILLIMMWKTEKYFEFKNRHFFGK